MSTTSSFADTSTYQEQGKLIRAPRDVARLGADLLGDKVNLYTGALEFVQTDVSLPGNSALPVSVGRRLLVGQEGNAAALFGKWDIEIPHMHGVFALQAGWQTSNGADSRARCSAFGPPPSMAGSLGSNSSWRGTEFWHGSFIYVPGAGDQEVLRRSPDNSKAPGGNVGSYPLVTRNNWAIRCLPSMAPGNGELGEAFIAVSPDGTEYRFDWLINRTLPLLTKSNAAPAASRMAGTSAAASVSDTEAAPADATPAAPVRASIKGESPDAIAGNALTRVEVWIMPTQVTDRFGNTVTYNYDSTYKRRLNSIVGSDASGNPRTISLTYGATGTAMANLVTSVSDGTHTWQYGYDSSFESANLATVTLPDGSAWRELDSLYGLLRNVNYLGEGDCDAPGDPNPYTLNGHLIHPSGARGEFTLAPTNHGRSGVALQCDLDATYSTYTPYYPKVFSTYALTQKKLTGPGIAELNWTTSYSPQASSWAPCNGCNASKQVTVTDPAGAVSRYTFGTLFRETEGQLQKTEILDGAGNVLRTSSQQYTDPITPRGVSDQRRGDGDMSARSSEVNLRQINQQGVDFTWQASSFDDYAKPTSVVRASALGSRTENTAYDNNVAKWVLGQVRTVTEASTGKVMVSNSYNANSALLESVSKFGLLQQSMTYNADGTLLTRSDALGHVTAFANYKRGLPRSVSYPDNSAESAEINDDGTIASVTDPMNLQTAYGYDAMGRLSGITYPRAPCVPPTACDPVWNPTTISFTRRDVDEFDLVAGHWRQDVNTGNGWTRIYMDALWRPAYAWSYETNVSGTQSLVKTTFDHAGRTTFASYPRREYDAQLVQGVTTSYDALGRPTEVRADSELGPLSTYSYYNNGFSKTVRDPRGNVSTTSYQAFDTPSDDALTGMTAPEGLLVAINRDVFGKPLAITRNGSSPAGVYAAATRSYIYDSYARLCKTIEPETGATLQQLDAANNVSWRALGTALTSAACDLTSVPSAAKVSFGYDAMNRLTTTSYGDGSAAIARDYWADGQPKSVTSAGAVWTMNYNGRRQPTSASLAFEGESYTLETIYNANGHPAQLTYPSATNSIGNQSVTYDPDALGRPTHVGSYASNLQYHPSGAIAGFSYGNGKVRTMTQNLRGLPALAQDTGVIQDAYAYDQNGNVTGITDQIGAGTSRSMSYDGLDRLYTANAPGMWGNASYGYDVLDNLRTSTIGSRVSTYNYGARNLLDTLQSTAGGFSFSYGYDNRGNVTSRGGQSFGFDLGNRLATATNLDTYVYDGFGRRVKTTAIDGTVTVTVYSPAGQLLYTRRTGGPNPAQSTQYIYLHQHQIAEVKK
ncbi:RHS repeat domain-containing protein [Massilia sp. PWRC2]|uniref:RHS repeat domain-containing protein n=1 Tax=Massilia sp. PWRC2 TaxID=2804626 RepID=UPI003CF23BB5